MANSVDATYDSKVLASTIYVRLRAAEGAVYTSGAATADFTLHAFNGASRRRFGIHCRGVRLSRLTGTAPEQTLKRSFLPVGTEAALDSIALESTITIGGIAWTVKGKVPESSV
jgi:hypothetical protein